ncbi:MAG: PIN domain-containing protein, partial [Actinobacteria bacterium]|nr:PIN domain-containing protein [Actinomycetota bacterium]
MLHLEASLNKNNLLKIIHEDIKNKSLGADELISNLFEISKVIPTTKIILEKAKYRFDIGNPPGKEGSYGDAINWECLIATIPSNQELHIIARDKDYIYKINSESLCEFLKDEWESKKSSKIFFYKTLSAFFSKHFPNIKLASELERESYISKLINSSAFATTHSAIRLLSQYSDFTQKEVNQIIKASIENNQISSISDD